ncbi:MAG: Flp pilus assembly complex ATPase component TadA [Hydrogenibacillus sp.]|nr:Flp pilus assembly complex ATPase component TadA [Hydrogenibacillus sp.]
MATEQAPERRWVEGAIARWASDVHIEPTSAGMYLLRVRVGGRLHPLGTLERRDGEALVQRLKVLAKLNIAERRLPQDGELLYEAADGRSYEIRLATLPTINGEKLTLRIIYPMTQYERLTELGMRPEEEDVIRRWLSADSGMVVIAGPTGSGKTTTLYTLLGLIDRRTHSVYTIEDPVEVRLSLAHQTAVNEAIGLTFETGLKALLRHDPDVIVVGEIRSKATADIVVRAALSGHLVLATVHAQDALTGIIRFFELGVEPYLVVSALRGVIGQRMRHPVCPACGGRPADCPMCRGLGVIPRPEFELYVPRPAHVPYLLDRRIEALKALLTEEAKYGDDGVDGHRRPVAAMLKKFDGFRAKENATGVKAGDEGDTGGRPSKG